MPVVLLGLSHRTAPQAIRDRHSVPANRIAEALRALSDYSVVREAAILSTCNRLEIYADVRTYEAGIAQLKEFLTTYRNMRVEDFDKYLYTMLGAQAVEQLFRVAGGLDSMLVGEPQILSQVKEALRVAEDADSIGPHLGRLFRIALQTGKRARAETAIGRDVVSLGAAAVELAERHCDISSARCVVLGAGQMGTAAAKHLAARNAASVMILNRTLRRAQVLARQIGAGAAGFDSLRRAVRDADLVISAIGSGRFIVTVSMMNDVLAHRSGKALLIVDIGVPRDVEPAVGALDGVVLYSLDDLRSVVDQTLEGRRSQIPAVEKIVAEQVGSYLAWYRARGAAPLIASLFQKAEEVRSSEIQRLFARMPELDARQREMVIAASVTIINRLLHAPVTKLRETAAAAADATSEQLSEAFLDVDAFADRLQRHLDAQAAPLSSHRKKR